MAKDSEVDKEERGWHRKVRLAKEDEVGKGG